jgi:hypothetical protein
MPLPYMLPSGRVASRLIEPCMAWGVWFVSQVWGVFLSATRLRCKAALLWLWPCIANDMGFSGQPYVRT